MTNPTKILVDSCSLINLINGGGFQYVLKIPVYGYIVTPTVYDEVAKIGSQQKIVDTHIEEGELSLYQDTIQLSDMQRLFDRYSLGAGETESIVVCKGLDYRFCCDDNKARRAAAIELNDPSMVFGSLRLLKDAVSSEILRCSEAYKCYQEMRFHGGFLPSDISHDYFCRSS